MTQAPTTPSERDVHVTRFPSVGLRRSLQGLLLCALLLPGAAVVSQTQTPVGRAVSVRGAVFAQSPDGERRVLQCRDPLYEGDRVITLEDSDVGIDAGSYYARLGEKSTAELGSLASGAPRLDLVNGHLRLIDSEEGAGVSAELDTPGLRVARTVGDQDALVFAEKAGVVSMVCAYGSDLDVARRTDPTLHLAAPSGSCVVGKPREALYAAPANHPQLAVLMRDACDELAMTPVAGRFSPGDVALGPAFAGGAGAAPPPVATTFASDSLVLPCSGGCGGVAPPPPVGPGLPTNFPFVPPVLPAP